MSETRDRIIAATNELFRRQGYNGTSLSQISKASNATIGSIYHFFPGGKEALGVAVIEVTGAVCRQLFESVAAETTDPVDAFEAMFSGGAEVLQSTGFIDPCPIGTIAREAANTSEPLRLAAEKAFDSWTDAASVHLAHCGVDDERAAELAQLFVAAIEGNFILSRTRRDTVAMESAGRLIGELTRAAIAARR